MDLFANLVLKGQWSLQKITALSKTKQKKRNKATHMHRLAERKRMMAMKGERFMVRFSTPATT